jgi:hypothetical protein
MRSNETHFKVRICKYFCNNFHNQKGLKQGDVLLPLLFYFALNYIILKAQENQVGLKLHVNGTHQLLVYAGHMNVTLKIP